MSAQTPQREGGSGRRGLSAATKSQIRQVVSLAIVILVLVGVIYTVAGGQYGKAEFVARFLFNRTPDIKEKPAEMVDLRALIKPTPALMAEGKQVFELNCVPCHGDDGFGNGPRAAGLNPPPRNFHQPKFRYGTDILTLFHTVTNGSPGTAMPSFDGVLSAAQRMAAVHYVQHWIPSPAPVTQAQIDALPQPRAEETGPTPLPPLQPVPAGPRIPIDLAMRLVAKQAPADPSVPPVADDAQGATLYARYCAACHRDDGGGDVPVEMLSSHPYVEVRASSFSRPLIPAWLNNKQAFSHLVTHGLPGRMMPGFGTLTTAQMDALYAHVQHLAGGTTKPVGAAGASNGGTK